MVSREHLVYDGGIWPVSPVPQLNFAIRYFSYSISYLLLGLRSENASVWRVLSFIIT